VVNGLIERHGGVQGVVNQLRSNGLGPTVTHGSMKGRMRRLRLKTFIEHSAIKR